jgi:hypothetical protein
MHIPNVCCVHEPPYTYGRGKKILADLPLTTKHTDKKKRPDTWLPLCSY